MRRGKGKILAFSVVVIGLLVLALAVFGYRESLLEGWHIHRLKTGDEKARIEAVTRLGDLRSERAVPRIVALVKTDDAYGRAALGALTRIRGEKAFAELVAILSRTDAALQQATAEALIASGPPLAEPVTELVRQLQGRSAPVVLWVLSQLFENSGDAAASTVLESLLLHRDAELRRNTLVGLWNLGLDEALIAPRGQQVLKDEDPDIRVHAVRLLAGLDGATDRIADFVGALEDPAPEVRKSTADAIGRLGSSAREAVPALLRRLDDENLPVAASAAHALGEIDNESLLKVLQSGSRRAKLAVCQVVGATQTEAAVPLLVDILQASDGDYDLREAALGALGGLRRLARGAVPVLARELGREKGPNRYTIALTRGDMGELAVDAVPALSRVLKDEDSGLRQRAAPALLESLRDEEVAGFAAEALAAIGEKAVPELVRPLTGDDPWLRAAAMGSLAQMGGGAQAASPALMKTLADPSPELRLQALATLRQVDAARTFVADPGFQRALEDDDPAVRFLAARTAAESGDSAARAIPVLAEVALDQDLVVNNRREALDSLATFGKDAVAVIAGLLGDEEPLVRKGAAMALGTIGPAARQAIGDLLPASHDDDPNVRRAAEDALKRIRAAAEAPEK